MRGFSKAIVAGNLTRDPEMRTTPNGATVCSFSIAVNRVYKDSAGNQREDVSFIDCAAWGKPGELIAQYKKKGSAILVSGRLDQRSWEDKETGRKRSHVEVTVEDFNLLGSSDRGDSGGGTREFGAANSVNDFSAPASEVVPDDIPDEPINMEEIPF